VLESHSPAGHKSALHLIEPDAEYARGNDQVDGIFWKRQPMTRKQRSTSRPNHPFCRKVFAASADRSDIPIERQHKSLWPGLQLG
jgi:hypothetical protein